MAMRKATDYQVTTRGFSDVALRSDVILSGRRSPESKDPYSFFVQENGFFDFAACGGFAQNDIQ